MDTQGFEAHILLGAKNLVASRTPILLEFWPYALKRTNSFGIGNSHYIDRKPGRYPN